MERAAARHPSPEVFELARGQRFRDRSIGRPARVAYSHSASGQDPVGNLGSGKLDSVFAIGELGQGSFRLVVQTIESSPNLPQLRTLIRGTSCGDQLGSRSPCDQAWPAHRAAAAGCRPRPPRRARLRTRTGGSYPAHGAASPGVTPTTPMTTASVWIRPSSCKGTAEESTSTPSSRASTTPTLTWSGFSTPIR